MKKIFLLLTAGVLSTTLLFAQKAVSIFNGKDLTGWTIHGTEKWYVEKGELICESGPDKAYGYLSTDKKYKDFDLTLQFKQDADEEHLWIVVPQVEGYQLSLRHDSQPLRDLGAHGRKLPENPAQVNFAEPNA